MCGIVGIFSKEKTGFFAQDASKFNQMLICDSVRGPDSTGVFGVSKTGNVDFLKQKGNPFELLYTPEYKTFANDIQWRYQFIVGHNRKATVGKISDETAHPFNEDHIILVHNGTLYDHKNLTDKEVEVDSHAICHAIASKGYKQALKEIKGAFSLVWYDTKEKCIRFVRNDQRPLSLFETDTRFYIASESDMAEWIITREVQNWTTKKWTKEEIDIGRVYTISLEDPTKIRREKVELYKYQAQTTQVIVHNTKKQESSNISSDPLPNDYIVVNVTESKDMFPKDSKYNTVLKGSKFIGNTTIPVYIFCTPQETEDYLKMSSNILYCRVDKLIYDKGNLLRISCDKPEEYIPQFDVQGEEVFLEEWKQCKDHKCSRCKKDTYWKDISKMRFKYKPHNRQRIICEECINTIDKRKFN